MKAIKFIFVTLFLCAFALTEVNAQAVVVKDQTWWAFGYYESYDAQEVLTPDGTVNLRINFQFDLTDPMIVEAILNGPYSIEDFAWGDNGMIPIVVTFYPNGRVKVNGHLEMEPDPD
mgnify:CR=1 FL=1